ncbi:hypothetical protein BU24DRAFT_41891 [Aaosphaeria arxii CBS 175.79]|uniref:Uncharacterized protein n=1 Tax=Aaosphaeria arxii CBS 175.79 TaxID=1450172 RepID=A0A6A5YAM1_9PLEO|nr:uncharacterized protein BU24DRAFT_41891 [Aaosphaeria arxii CBS 175.79]KAF2022286.1 hypothetical protein BU24DRAFT_41891 [Aaosphaeria arxii CBS 175.79]
MSQRQNPRAHAQSSASATPGASAPLDPREASLIDFVQGNPTQRERRQQRRQRKRQDDATADAELDAGSSLSSQGGDATENKALNTSPSDQVEDSEINKQLEHLTVDAAENDQMEDIVPDSDERSTESKEPEKSEVQQQDPLVNEVGPDDSDDNVASVADGESMEVDQDPSASNESEQIAEASIVGPRLKIL